MSENPTVPLLDALKAISSALSYPPGLSDAINRFELSVAQAEAAHEAETVDEAPTDEPKVSDEPQEASAPVTDGPASVATANPSSDPAE